MGGPGGAPARRAPRTRARAPRRRRRWCTGGRIPRRGWAGGRSEGAGARRRGGRRRRRRGRPGSPWTRHDATASLARWARSVAFRLARACWANSPWAQ
jgi:hypothetical protein